ncbi:MAG: signal peptidase I [Firmicutes bacterium]|jgi:signal peptidase I|nr:signal peptidase I [Bacillota bacterium]NBI64617.1 signal peptidase I [Clostridiales bacterium]
MANKDLNVFEILGEKEPDSRKPVHQEPNEWNEWSKYFENRIEERHTWNTNGQEQNAPDRFFDEEIIRAMSGERVQQSPPDPNSRAKHRDKGQRARDLAGGLLKKLPSITARQSIKHEKHAEAAGAVSGGWKSILAEIAVVVLAIFLITQFFISISYVSGDSMNPAFYDGDRVVIQRFAKGSIKKGDVIVFETKNEEKLIKRVIATVGDTVDISKNQGGLYVNGEAIEEDYIYTVTAISDEGTSYPITVGEDSYFVLGDNRTNSKDSRDSEIGLVSKEDIVGKVILSIRGNIGERHETTTGKDTQ